jgi:polysaccharide pyruvyl transferase WcaK-like protein
VTCAGAPNFGDELVAATWLRHLSMTRPDDDVVVDCINPEVAAVHLQCLHPRVRFTNTLWWLVGLQSGVEPRAAASAAERRALRVTGLRPRGAPQGAAAADLRAAATIHLVGGGYINRLWPHMISLLAAVTAVAAQTGARTVMTGQCLWPPADGYEDLIRELACRFDMTDVRDEPSGRLIETASPTTTGDDVFLGTALAVRAPGAELPEVMVCLQSQLATMPAQWLVQFARDTLAAWDVDEAGLLNCAPGMDDEVIELAMAQLPIVARYDVDEALSAGFPATAGQTWISTRFHPHLVAAAAGAAGIAVSIEPDYYITKHGSLIAAGSGWHLVDDLSSAPARPERGGYTPGRLAELQAAKRQLADRIYPPDAATLAETTGKPQPGAVRQ